jgi:hypothetical protein
VAFLAIEIHDSNFVKYIWDRGFIDFVVKLHTVRGLRRRDVEDDVRNDLSHSSDWRNSKREGLQNLNPE